MNIPKKKDRSSVFSQHNIVLWLPVYNITYLIFGIIYKSDLKIAFLMGSLLCVSFTLIFFTAAELFENIHEEETQKENSVVEVSKRIREEYQKAHKINRTKKLLLETKLQNLNISKSKNQQKVNLSYTDRSSPDGLHENKS